MTYLFEILLIAVNITMAWWHSRLIERGQTPQHGWWGLAYVVLTAGLAVASHSWLLIAASLLIRKIVFDLSLNLFRGLPLFYVSSSTTSIIDRWHMKLFGKRSEIYMGIYLILLITTNFFL